MAEAQHREALVETARTELDRAHRGALSMEAAEMRRGLELAILALREGATLAIPDSTRVDEQRGRALGHLAEALEEALGDLDGGALMEMESLIEGVRKELDG